MISRFKGTARGGKEEYGSSHIVEGSGSLSHVTTAFISEVSSCQLWQIAVNSRDALLRILNDSPVDGAWSSLLSSTQDSAVGVRLGSDWVKTSQHLDESH